MNRQDQIDSPSPGFVHLHCHDEHSFLDGMSRTAGLAERGASLGFTAQASTNHGNLAGAWTFAHACKAHHIKPILGCEIYLAIGSRWDPQEIVVPRGVSTDDDSDAAAESTTWEGEASDLDPSAGKKKSNYHLTVLAATPTGWRNLVTMMNRAQDSYFRKPLVDYELLAEHAEGLIVLTGCLGGPVASRLAMGDIDGARAALDQLIGAVGRDNVYVELMDHDMEAERTVLTGLRKLAEDYDLPMVATNDSHHTDADHAAAHEIWLAAQSGKTIDDPKRFQFHGSGYHLRSEEEMRELWPDSAVWQQACSNTVAVAERIDDWVLPKPGMLLPKFPLVPDEFNGDSNAYLHHLVVEGAVERYGTPFTPELKARLRHEEDVITGMGMADYFLIVWELINWCRKQGIQVGPGRGSAGGSVTAYCLGITAAQVEPMANGLLFERFLEPGRIGMPDIDLDFEKNRTEEVRAHLRELYGFDCVARIGTFSTAATRKALLSASRTLLGSETVGRKLADLVPIEGGKPLKLKVLCDETNPAGQAFRDMRSSLDGADEVIDAARVFEDVIDGFGMHACGVIVSPVPLIDLIPLRHEPAPKGYTGSRSELPWVTEWDGPSCEKFGLLKVDVLGLRTLDVVAGTFRMVEAETGEVLTMELMPDPDDLSDPRVRAAYDLLGRGQTTGIFQLEGGGITDLTTRVQPHSLADLTAIAALYRPGPMSAGSHTAYADRKQGREASTNQWTNDPAEAALIDAVFADTYNLLVYQEQIMALAGRVAGYDAGERSRLRKAVGKKDKDIMAAVRAELVPRMVVEQRNADGTLLSPALREKTALALVDSIEACGSYLFNKSHSATYGFLSFVTAYLKANWPTEFAAANLAVTEDMDKRRTQLLAFGAEGVEVSAPDVNTSAVSTIAADGVVRFGLSEIRDVSSAADDILAERQAHGPFASLADLTERVEVHTRTGNGVSKLTSRVLVGLAESGALDCFGASRLELVMSAWSGARLIEGLQASWPEWEQAARQRQRIGVNVGQHPLERYATRLAEWSPPDVTDERGDPVTIRPVPILNVLDDDRPGSASRSLSTIGLLTSWKRKPYSRGVLASFTLEAADGRQIDGVMWNESLAEMAADPVPGMLVCVSGSTTRRTILLTPAVDDGDDDTDRVAEQVSVTQMTASRIWEVSLGERAELQLAGPGVVVDFAEAQRRLSAAAAMGRTKRQPQAAIEQPARPTAAPKPAPQVASVSDLSRRRPGRIVDVPRRPGEESRSQAQPDRSIEGSLVYSATRNIALSLAVSLPCGDRPQPPDPRDAVAAAAISGLDEGSRREPCLLRVPLEMSATGFVIVYLHDEGVEAPHSRDEVLLAARRAKWVAGPRGGCEMAAIPAAAPVAEMQPRLLA